MIVPFTKMHGLGNDFVVVDAISQPVYFNEAQIQRLANRHYGIGFDQLLLVEAPQHPQVDFHYRIFNADGKEVGQCGNGARCLARYVRQKGLTWKNRLSFSTQTGVMKARLERNGLVSVDMGQPQFEPDKLPMTLSAQRQYQLQLEDQSVEFGAVSLGNPHCVLQVEDVASAPVDTLGPRLGSHAIFPRQVNVGFMQVMHEREINLRVFERGAGETNACGSGACAAMVVGRAQGLLAERVKVNLPGGYLMVQWRGEGQSVQMTGPATFVFEGQFEL